MTVVVAFANLAPSSTPELLQSLHLPNLHALLALSSLQMGPQREDAAWSLSAVHEQAFARACGIDAPDGCVPLGAALALEAGWDGGKPWGRITPSHWRLGTEQVSLLDPAQLQLDEASSRALFDAARVLFEDEGFGLHWLAPDTWLVEHPMLEHLPCASLDRVIGRNVDLWLGSDARTRPLRRLQSEVQMLWHRHPVNEAREAGGLDAVNSFWLDGCGRWPPHVPLPLVNIDERLRAPALAGDEAAWRAAFQDVDATLMHSLLEQVRSGQGTELWLCGERRWCRLRFGVESDGPLDASVDAHLEASPGARRPARSPTNLGAVGKRLLRLWQRWRGQSSTQSLALPSLLQRL